MSIRIMSAIWTADIMATRKIVALALADCADDDGRCWPSVAHLAKKCSMSERSIQVHLAGLTRDGILRREERPGRSAIYNIDPHKICTSANLAPPKILHPPPQIVHPTPANPAPGNIKNHQVSITTHLKQLADGGGQGEEAAEYIRLATQDSASGRDVRDPVAFAASIRRRLIQQGGLQNEDRQQLGILRARQVDVQAMHDRLAWQRGECSPLLSPEEEPVVWRQACTLLNKSLSASDYSLWIEHLTVGQEGDTLQLVGQDQLFCFWVAEHYLTFIQEALAEAGWTGQVRLMTQAEAASVSGHSTGSATRVGSCRSP